MAESWQETCAALDAGARYAVRCPDGITRTIWGYNGPTGDVFITGWQEDAWMDCSNGTFRVDFTKENQ